MNSIDKLHKINLTQERKNYVKLLNTYKEQILENILQE